MTLIFIVACNNSTIENTELTKALGETFDKANYSEKELIDGRFDELLADQLKQMQLQDTSQIILKTKIYDKTLIAFPIKKSKRLDYHIFKLKNDEAVRIGLHENFYEFENCKFNRELNLAKFYFDDPISDTTTTKFFNMCILPDFEVVEI